MKIKFLGLIFATLITVNAYANFDQTIKLCLDATENDTATNFEGYFKSSDIFDKGESTPPNIHDSRYCISHHYGYGPKKIIIKLNAWPSRNNMTLLVPTESCSYLANFKGDPITLKSNYIRTTAKVENWDIKFLKGVPQNGYNTVFNVVCEHKTQA